MISLLEPTELLTSINFIVTPDVYSNQICFRSDFIYDIVEPMKPSVPTAGTKKSKKRPTVSSQFKVNFIYFFNSVNCFNIPGILGNFHQFSFYIEHRTYFILVGRTLNK